MGSLFREKAMKKLGVNEEFTYPLHVVTPFGWLALAALFALIIFALLWSFLGSIPISAEGKGIILTQGGLFTIDAKESGVVTNVFIKNGDWITPDTLILEMQNENKKTTRIYAHERGKVLEVYAKANEKIRKEDPIVWAEVPLNENEPYQAFAFYTVDKGEKISKGMEAKICLENADIAKYGFLLGKVRDVSQFPVTKRSMLTQIQNKEIVSLLSGENRSTLRIDIALTQDKNAPSGYLWTTPNVPKSLIESGRICDITIITEKRKPISYLFPHYSTEDK